MRKDRRQARVHIDEADEIIIPNFNSAIVFFVYVWQRSE